MQWDDTVMDSVDWDSLGTAIQQSSEMKTFVTKLHHDLLPTGHRVHRYQAYYEKSCPSCDHENEDQAHLFQCHDDRREEWRIQFVQTIRTKCRSRRVAPSLTTLLIQGIESILFDTTFPAYEEDVPPSLRPLAKEQGRIGWHQLIRGYWPKQWEQHQQTYSEDANPNEHDGQSYSSSWVSTIQHLIWNEVHKLWIIRNEDRHGKEELMKVERQCAQFRREAEWLYGMKAQCLPSHRSTIFHSSFQAHAVTTENTIHQLGAWLRLNKTTILASVMKHQAQRTGQNPPPTARRSTRAAPTHRTSASLPRYRQLTIHAALEQSIVLNQRNAQDPVLAAALQIEAQDDISTSASSSTSTDTQSSYRSSSEESSEDDDSSDGPVRFGGFDRSHRNSRPKVKMKQAHSHTFSTLS
jgi:hypothetical protein